MKTGFILGIAVILLATATVTAQISQIPAAEQAKEKSVAPEYSLVIDEDWNLQLPYWVDSDNPILKGLLNVRHDFDGYFSADLTPVQINILGLLGVETEPVQLWHVTDKPEVTGKPICGDGEAHPSEQCGEPGLPECPEGYTCVECKCKAEEEEPAPACYPDSQYPWGIAKVNGGSGGTGVDVAVLDTGVMTDHPDLAGRIIDCKDFTKGPKVKSTCKDGLGHGTHVSGTILADGGAGLGIYGVAPEANLMAYKVCSDAGSCWTDDIAAAIDYAAANGAEIVSMSIGGDTQSTYIKNAIDGNPGVLYVAAAGNDGPEDGSIDYPGAYVKVIAAGAIRFDETVPDWSSRGINDGDYVMEEKEVEFGTPGVSIESTYNDGCYAYMSGTSMATPHVSGLAAKLWDIADGTLDGIGNAADTRAYLQSIANDIWETGDDTATGFGLPIAP